MKEVIEVLNKVHDFLGILIRENLIKEAPYLDEEPMLKVSDLADDLWEVIHKKLPCNNAAAMLKALENIVHHFCTNCPNNGPDECELSKVEGRFEFRCHKIKQARAALAKPPRNCDRFVDELDAQIEFLNDVWLISVTKDTMLERDKFENWTEEMKSRYAKWLFAEAKGEQK